MENLSSSLRPAENGNDVDERISGRRSPAEDSREIVPSEFPGGECQVSSMFPTAEFPKVVLDTPAGGYENEYALKNVTSSGENHGYTSSSSSSQRSGGDVLREYSDDDEMARLNSRTSSRSSISSMTGSILVHSADVSKTSAASEACTDSYHVGHYNRSKKRYESTRPAPNMRNRETPFRKPSSVRAMQMHTEDEDEEYLTPLQRLGSTHSPRISERSIGSSPLKRSPYYSSNTSKQKVKKEYPLVLLHCNLLPPTLSLPSGVGVPSPRLLREVLPPRYWRRWKLLEEKVGSGLLRDRGVLISHPQEMYDVLEETLLESLELFQPRLRNGHFLGNDGYDSDDDDHHYQDSDTDGAEGEECPDCGVRVVKRNNGGRKWEIKVYAANGLMRARAWAAAWREMEKVDVEVGLWLPSSVRRELERRLLEEDAIGYGHELRVCEKRREVYGEQQQPQPSQEQIDDLDNAPQLTRGNSAVPNSALTHQEPRHITAPLQHVRRAADEVKLQTLLINYIRVLASDRRNVAIAFLSVLVVFLAIGGARPTQPISSQVGPFHPAMVASQPPPP
ncbi:hypothetical protein VTN00DRAFT_9134 [Thermoascus crustaceus]|uniref:uncharacterized protein n=1 Tax=Thermoascus crustaceus TaxID=5088 RepID=UPI003744570A